MSKSKTRRRFGADMRAQVVKAVKEDGETQADVGRRLGLSKSLVSRWVMDAEHADALRSARGKAISDGMRRAPAVVESVGPLLTALQNVARALEPLAPRERRTAIEAVLRLQPP